MAELFEVEGPQTRSKGALTCATGDDTTTNKRRRVERETPIEFSDYELERDKKVRENQELLACLGLLKNNAPVEPANQAGEVAAEASATDTIVDARTVTPIKPPQRRSPRKPVKIVPDTVAAERKPFKESVVPQVHFAAIAAEQPLVKGRRHVIKFKCDDAQLLRDAYAILIKSQGLSEWLYVIHRHLDCTALAQEGEWLLLEWTVPMDVDPGKNFTVEIASVAVVFEGLHERNKNGGSGAIGESNDFEIVNPVGSWVVCSSCKAWQHSSCYRKEYKDHGAITTQIPEDFQCTWCSNAYHSATMMRRMTAMVAALPTKYRRVHNASLCSTPDHVVEFLRTLLQATDQKTADFGAGTGQLSRALPAGALCIESSKARFKTGQATLPLHEWRHADVLSKTFCQDIATRTPEEKFDLVVSNPDFEVALQFIYLGLMAIKDSPHARLMFILPSDYFEGSPVRSRVFKILDVHIEKEYKLGHLGYYADNRGMEKQTVDSLFILKRGRDGKYEHTVVNARLAGML